MQNKLYVGNLPFSISEDDMKDHFSEAGTINSVNIIVDRDTNRSKGFGFVEMGSDEEAAKAIELFDGKEFDGRALKVNIAKPREERPRRNNW